MPTWKSNCLPGIADDEEDCKTEGYAGLPEPSPWVLPLSVSRPAVLLSVY